MSMIRILNASLDQFEGREVIRGVLDNDTITNLQVDDYQRERLGQKKIMNLAEALKTTTVPDIDVGMRGTNWSDDKVIEGAVILKSPCYVIDGWQRVSAANVLLQRGTSNFRLGIMAHVDTDRNWERRRFESLNLQRNKLSPNVTLRNLREDIEAIAVLYKLCSDKNFALFERVCWDNNMSRNQLLSARLYLSAVASLHNRFGPTGGSGLSMKVAISGLQIAMTNTGRLNFKQNVILFWEILDQCFGIRAVAFRNMASHIKGGFLMAFSSVLAKHANFWQGSRLNVPMDVRQKIKQFPLTDPNVIALCGSSSQGAVLLANLLVDHINSGRRTTRLTPQPLWGDMTAKQRREALGNNAIITDANDVADEAPEVLMEDETAGV